MMMVYFEVLYNFQKFAMTLGNFAEISQDCTETFEKSNIVLH
jgi:hypothetical protein